jgi:hydroxymethylglutaryl-CoA synthase
MSISEKLNTRIIVDPKAFVTTMHLMETRYGAKDFVPVSSHATLRPGTFYLTEVDGLYRRRYSRKISTTKPEIISSNGTNGVQFN